MVNEVLNIADTLIAGEKADRLVMELCAGAKIPILRHFLEMTKKTDRAGNR